MIARPRVRLRTKVANYLGLLRTKMSHFLGLLRTKVALFLGFIALITSVSLWVTYGGTRSALLSERQRTAQQQAIENARDVRQSLRNQREDFSEWFRTFVRPDPEGGLNYTRRDDTPVAASVAHAPDAFPAQLRTTAMEGDAGMMRFRYDGNRFVGVAVPLDDVDAIYFEAFPLGETERILRLLVIGISIGSGAGGLLVIAAGVWTVRRLLHPLRRLTDAAGMITGGDLTTRVPAERDPDLAPLVESFNQMADAVQDRIEREARFASDVSHELRSPLAALSAATDVLAGRRSELPERAQQAVDVVVNQVKRFDSMVLDLLELSRLDAGASDLNREPVEIAELTRRIAGRYGFAEVPIDVAAGAPQFVSVDRLRFERILGNLLENADQHAGGPVRIGIAPGPDGFVEIAVDDEGPGVTDEDRERIFARFTRGSSSRRGGGTGLGLALVAEHTSAHGGEAWVEDRDGVGARFVVRLPAGEEDS